MRLEALLRESAKAAPDRDAVVVRDTRCSYRELDELAERHARNLQAAGIRPGDRVGIYAKKSIGVVAAMQAVLRVGAAYVPVDTKSPPDRARGVFSDCGVGAVVIDAASRGVFQGHLADGARPVVEVILGPDGAPTGQRAPETDVSAEGPRMTTIGDAEAIAFVLYTSGSTGKPKGVCISHNNARAFVEWAADQVGATADDRFANHASFNFDLSVFDLYCAFARSACVVIVPEEDSYSGKKLVRFLDDHEISIWYSVPTALMLMMNEGDLLSAPHPRLRVIVFAGEVFAINPLRRLRASLPSVRLVNYYGPTETNVCTYFEVDDLPADLARPVPIGRAASGDRVWAEKSDGTVALLGEEGELVVAGPTVMKGYWGREPQGQAPYRTGDIVRVLPGDNFDYVGRRDHMVKVRGFRIELGEIEARLLQFPGVSAACALVTGEGMTARIEAFLETDVLQPPSLIRIKQHCIETLPAYMNVARVHARLKLPTTSNGKLDRLALQREALAMAENEGGDR